MGEHHLDRYGKVREVWIHSFEAKVLGDVISKVKLTLLVKEHQTCRSHAL